MQFEREDKTTFLYACLVYFTESQFPVMFIFKSLFNVSNLFSGLLHLAEKF